MIAITKTTAPAMTYAGGSAMSGGATGAWVFEQKSARVRPAGTRVVTDHVCLATSGRNAGTTGVPAWSPPT